MSEHMSDVTFGKVFAGMLAGMVALTIFLIILAHAVGGGIPESDVKTKARDEVTQARTAPEGSLAVGEVAAQPAVQVAASAPSGEQVYQSGVRRMLEDLSDHSRVSASSRFNMARHTAVRAA